MYLAEFAGDVVGQCRYGELNFVRTSALILEVGGVETRMSECRTQIGRAQRHRVGATIVVVVLVVERPCLARHRCVIVEIDVGGTVVVVTAPLLYEKVLATKLYLLFCGVIAVGKPCTRLTDTVTGIHLSVRILVAAFFFVV